MNEKSKQAIPVKTSSEILQEVTNKLKNHIPDPTSKPSFVEVLGLIAVNYSEAVSENQARKSPGQRAKEAKQSQLSAQAYRLKKTNEDQVKLIDFFKEWLKRDTWLIYDEAMPLIKGEKPEAEGFLNTRNAKLWGLVQSCAGHSLTLSNAGTKPKEWRVKPFEWVRWLLEKEQGIHAQLINLVYPKTNIQPTIKTTHAINSRELIKRNRLIAIRKFATLAEELARKQNIDWSSKQIPVTKAEFLSVFRKQYPLIKKFSIDSFNRDIAEIGITFKSGTKSNKNNVLKIIFSTV